MNNKNNGANKLKFFNTSMLYATWLQFVIRYRKTLLGPAWLLVGPALFIIMLGVLFSEIGGATSAVFVPHLTVGLITWTLISGFVSGSADIFERSREAILSGSMSLKEIVIVDVFTNFLIFAHQLLIIVAVFLFYGISVSLSVLVSLIGVSLLIINGIWLSYFFGILGARFRDLKEVVQAVMRIAFLATPIIWMPADTQRAGVLNIFTTFNPFYHFLEVVRAPMLGAPVQPISWAVVMIITLAGIALAFWFHRRYSELVPLWL